MHTLMSVSTRCRYITTILGLIIIFLVSTLQWNRQRPNRLRIAIATFVTGESSYTQLSLKNKHAYARKHGYTLEIDYETDPSLPDPMWHKFVMIDRLIEAAQHDWIWWIDFDTLVMNGNITLENIVQDALAEVEDDSKIDLLLNVDCDDFNAGSMFVRSKHSSLALFDRARAYLDGHPKLSEQECIRDVIKQDRADSDNGKNISWSDEHIKFIPQSKANAYPEEIRCTEVADRPWIAGDFLVHFPGARFHVEGRDPKGQLMRKYSKFVENL